MAIVTAVVTGVIYAATATATAVAAVGTATAANRPLPPPSNNYAYHWDYVSDYAFNPNNQNNRGWIVEFKSRAHPKLFMHVHLYKGKRWDIYINFTWPRANGRYVQQYRMSNRKEVKRISKQILHNKFK
eukprot:423929_1